jgi:hypothetical protein
MRPRYESESDRKHEALIVGEICNQWDVEAKKVPIRYEFDYALMKADMSSWKLEPIVVGILEIKRRKKKYKTLMISMQKVATMQMYSQQFDIPAILAVSWPNEETQYTILQQRRTAGYRIEWGGRRDRGDSQDEEPVIHIPVEHFHLVSESARKEPTSA